MAIKKLTCSGGIQTNSTILLLLFGLAYAIVSVTGVTLIKMEMSSHSLRNVKDYLDLLLTWKVIAGFLIIGVAALIQIKILSIWKMSYSIPITTACYFSLLLFVGVWFFGEKLSVFSLIGLVFILTGIIFLSIKAA